MVYTNGYTVMVYKWLYPHNFMWLDMGKPSINIFWEISFWSVHIVIHSFAITDTAVIPRVVFRREWGGWSGSNRSTIRRHPEAPYTSMPSY